MALSINEKVKLYLRYSNHKREIDDLRSLIYELTTGATELDPRHYASPQELDQDLKNKLRTLDDFEKYVIGLGGDTLLNEISDVNLIFSEFWKVKVGEIDERIIKQIYDKRPELVGMPFWDQELYHKLEKHSELLNPLIRVIVNIKIKTPSVLEYGFNFVRTATKPIGGLMFIYLYNKKEQDYRIFLTLQDLIQEMFSRWVYDYAHSERRWYKMIPRNWDGDTWYRKWKRFLKMLPDWEIKMQYELYKIVGYGRWKIDDVLSHVNKNQQRYWATVISMLWNYREEIKNRKPFHHLIPYSDTWQPVKIPYSFFFEDKRTGITEDDLNLAKKILSPAPGVIRRKPEYEKDLEYSCLEAIEVVRILIEQIYDKMDRLRAANRKQVAGILWDYFNYIRDVHRQKETEGEIAIVRAFNMINRFKPNVEKINNVIEKTLLEKIDKTSMMPEIINELLAALVVVEDKSKQTKINKKIVSILSQPTRIS